MSGQYAARQNLFVNTVAVSVHAEHRQTNTDGFSWPRSETPTETAMAQKHNASAWRHKKIKIIQ